MFTHYLKIKLPVNLQTSKIIQWICSVCNKIYTISYRFLCKIKMQYLPIFLLVCDNYISPYFFATCIQYNSAILFISHLLACQYRFTWNLSSEYQTLRRKCGMQYRSRCNIFSSSEMLYFLCLNILQASGYNTVTFGMSCNLTM
jgi:hypothetical protein